MTACRSEDKKRAGVPAAEEQEDGEVQMAPPAAQAASGMPIISQGKKHSELEVCMM